jgi:hypothetical protein
VAKNDILTYEEAMQLFDYNPESGIITWKIDNHKARIGNIAGYLHSYGYIQIMVGHREYRAHRLAWLLMYKVWPSKNIDHINGIRDDNRIFNLRDVSQRENSCNRKEHREGKRPGYFYNQWEKRWDARIFYAHKLKRLGVYDTEDQAAHAYEVALQETLEGKEPGFYQPKNKYRFINRIPRNQKSNYGKLSHKPEIQQFYGRVEN